MHKIHIWSKRKTKCCMISSLSGLRSKVTSARGALLSPMRNWNLAFSSSPSHCNVILEHSPSFGLPQSGNAALVSQHPPDECQTASPSLLLIISSLLVGRSVFALLVRATGSHIQSQTNQPRLLDAWQSGQAPLLVPRISSPSKPR